MDETFRVFDRILSFAGISIFAKPNWNSKGWLIIQTFNFLLGFLTFIFTSVFVILNLSNLLVCIQGACVWTTGVIMFISLGICLVFKKNFQGFVEEMAFCDRALDIPLVRSVMSLPTTTGKLHELKNLVLSSQIRVFKVTKMLLKTYVASVWLCATLYLCGPIYMMTIREDENLRLLAFDMWFPWSLDDFNVYIGSFIFHAYTGYLCCIAYPGLQAMIIFLVCQVIRQLQIITFILTYLDDLVLEVIGTRNERWQVACTSVLSQCIQHYVRTKRFANRLNVICQPFYLALILVAIMLVCVCSVKIAVSPKLALNTIKYYIHEFCFILVVLMFCALGQQVENQCEKLELAVTEKWYIFNRQHKINVLIFNMALSQRMPIFVFGSITLSLPTFTWFIKTGMSFFTLVMSVLET
ncbi:odorant receptor 4-like [Pieris napi]|uniref:odorant receptor 4-like n=1 Tax=Pieris napi TaxID=78633 RepID=UPI001FB89FAE|nr:odorant receptor 4-like [Pieris napi]